MIGFIYPIEEHAKKGMMMQTLQNGILKLNHLLPNELFNGRKTCTCWGSKRLQATLSCCWKRKVLLSTHVKVSRKKVC
jgi:hypothetical protein